MSTIRVTRVVTPDDEAAFDAVRRPDGAAPPAQARADVERMIAWVGESPMARCTNTVAENLAGAPGRSGLIGHYEALDATAGIALLEFTARQVALRKVQRILGPMNGSTWASYRLALAAEPDDPQGNPPFFLGEPRNPFEYHEQFMNAGFVVCARYESRSYMTAPQDATTEPPPPLSFVERDLAIDVLDPALFEETLRDVYALSLEAFAENAYYSPIAAGEFMAAYERLRPMLDPRLVLLVRDASGALVSFLFGYPDPLWMPRGTPVRAIIKTVATAARFRGAGITRHLLELFRIRATALAYEEVIHALMHVGNTSMRLSGEQDSVLFRRYALYQWQP